MESKVVEKLQSEFETVILVRSNNKPNDALQALPGKYFCIMTMFAVAVTKRKTIVFDRKTYGCPGACAGLGFGSCYENKEYGGYDFFASFFSQGLSVANNKELYKAIVRKMPLREQRKFIEGERFHCSKEKAYNWITQELPIYNFPEKYRIIKPLSKLTEKEIPESVIFTVNPIQLAALITLVGAFMDGINVTVTPQGAACQMIGAYVFKEGRSANPKAVLGLLDLAARKNIKKLLPTNVLTYSVPWKLFLQMEETADNCVFDSPIWKDLI